jgi:hypothetical protein
MPIAKALDHGRGIAELKRGMLEMKCQLKEQQSQIRKLESLLTSADQRFIDLEGTLVSKANTVDIRNGVERQVEEIRADLETRVSATDLRQSLDLIPSSDQMSQLERRNHDSGEKLEAKLQDLVARYATEIRQAVDEKPAMSTVDLALKAKADHVDMRELSQVMLKATRDISKLKRDFRKVEERHSHGHGHEHHHGHHGSSKDINSKEDNNKAATGRATMVSNAKALEIEARLESKQQKAVERKIAEIDKVLVEVQNKVLEEKKCRELTEHQQVAILHAVQKMQKNVLQIRMDSEKTAGALAQTQQVIMTEYATHELHSPRRPSAQQPTQRRETTRRRSANKRGISLSPRASGAEAAIGAVSGSGNGSGDSDGDGKGDGNGNGNGGLPPITAGDGGWP